MLLYPSRFITVWASDPSAPARGGLPPSFMGHGSLGACGGERYYYQWWLSDRTTREAISEWWMSHDLEEGEEQTNRRGWWKLRVPCRLTRVLGIESVLKRTFGDKWNVPAATVTKPTRTW